MQDTVAERFRTARRNAHLTQDQAAKAIGVDKHSISHWETGMREPGLSNLRAAARVYGVSVEWLVGKRIAAVEQTAFTAKARADARRMAQKEALDAR